VRIERRGLWLAVIALVVMAFAATGCGKVKGVAAQPGPVGDRAKAEGKQAAADEGGRTKVPSANVALLLMNGKDDSGKRLKAEITDLGKKNLGWAPSPCDGKGDAKMLEQCAEGIIDSGPVDFILSNGIPPKDMSRVLKKAYFKHVPVINIGSTVAPSKLFAASYTPDDRAAAQKLDTYFIGHLKHLPPQERKIVVLSSSTGGGSERYRQLKSDIQGTGIRIIDEAQADQKKPATDKKTVKKLLDKHPDVKGVWLAQPSSVVPAGDAVDKGFKNLKYPSRPLVVGFNAEPKTSDAIRDDKVDAVSDVAYDATLYMALDQIAEDLGRQRPIAKTVQDANYPLDFLDIALVTRDNAPAKGKWREPKEDFVNFFKSKWRREFGSPPKPGG
jgi:ABC-type sugar transport system substrate-binding protein